jgi:hypothetical protein
MQKKPPLRTSKLLEKPSALKREHPPLQKKKFINCFLFFSAIFALLDPVRESGSKDPFKSGSNPDPGPQHEFITFKFCVMAKGSVKGSVLR